VSVWNAWAIEQLARRAALEVSSEFILRRNNDYGYIAAEKFGGNTPTLAWLEAARVDFAGFIFETRPNFGGFIFPGQSWFGESTYARQERKPRTVASFPAGARFSQAVFHLDAVFDRVEFVQIAGFREVEFRGIARFDDCKFKDSAWFLGATFLDEVWFGQSGFTGYTNFSNATFKSNVSFSAARCEGAFNLNEALFKTIPDFTQTSFRETPRLDNLTLPSIAFFPRMKKKSAVNAQALYRALRRLAIASQDYDTELLAFKGEIRARRGDVDKPWHLGYCLGVVYDALSDFGRSMTRPFLAWIASIIGFTIAYLANAEKLSLLHAPCADGAPYWENALAVSAKNALVVAGADRKIDEQYTCLFGSIVPVSTTFIQIAQAVCSAILLFFFLLAVRNRFKIK